jgi:DNA-binding NarL/FixJ family response regulator
VTIKVFIADDHQIVREGLRRILAEKHDIEVVGEAATFAGLIEQLPEVRPEIVILDISMPGPGFLESVRILRDREVRVLVLSMHPESHFAVRALKAGASAYLSKERTPGELIGAIQRVHEGRTYLTPSVAEELAERLVADSDQSRHEHLSEREFQVLLMLGSGRTVGEISRELSLSPKTVSTYRARILQKLELQTTSDLVRYALQNQLV